MHEGETNVTVLTSSTIDDFVNQDIPSFVFFTSKQCHGCHNTDFQAVVLADIYSKDSHPGRVGVICIRENIEVARKYHVHTLPTVRLYYRGLYHEYMHYGENFKLMNMFFDGKFNFKEIFLLKDTGLNKWNKFMNYSRHALVYYGHEVPRLDAKIQELLRTLYFKFGDDFRFFNIESTKVGDHLGLKLHNLYEYNKYDDKFREVDIKAYLSKDKFDMQEFTKIADFIHFHSYPKVSLWNINWMKVHRNHNMTIFYAKYSGSPEEEVFNKSCQSALYKKTRCMIYDFDDNSRMKLESIYHVPLSALPDKTVLEMKFCQHERIPYVLNAEGLTSERLEEFIDNVNAHKINPFYSINEKIPLDNHQREIKILNSELLNRHFKNNDMDAMIMFYNSTGTSLELENADKMEYKMKIAWRYIIERLPDIKVIFGKIDCSKNECHYAAGHNDFPVVYYYKAFEHFQSSGMRQIDHDYRIADYVHLFASRYSFGKYDDMLWPIDKHTGEYLSDNEVIDYESMEDL